MAKNNAQDLAAEAGRLAGEYERACTGCAQSAVAGLLDALGIESDDAFKAASGLADGIGLSGNGSCGSLIGCCMVIGLVHGRERRDHRDVLKPMRSYLLCKELQDDFVREYGAVRCHDVQQRLMGRTFDLLDPKEFEEAMREGMIERCSHVVDRTARRAAELILREQAAKDSGAAADS